MIPVPLLSWALDIVNTINLPQTSTDISNPGNSANATATALANRIAELLIIVAFPIAVVAITYSTFVLLTSFGKPEGYTKVKKNMLALITGMFLLVFAVILARLIYSIFA